jgi:hypothetical protein
MLGETYFLCGNYDKAYQYNTESLVTRLELFGKDYKNTKQSIELAKKIHAKIGRGSFDEWLKGIIEGECS